MMACLGAPEVKLGIFPPLDLVPRLEWWVGVWAAKHMVLTGQLVDAAEAITALAPVGVASSKGAFAAARERG